jgi:hypothetical protein
LSFTWKHKVDHCIKFKNMNDKKSESFWESLYNMSYKELLVLQKMLTKLLNKSFIYISNFSAAVSMFFMRKSEKELYFYCDYCELNQITRKN